MKKLKKALFWLTIGITACAVIDQLQRPPGARTWRGSILGVPYDLRPPTLARLQSSWWNPEDARLFTPKSFGVGWDLNLHRLMTLALSRGQTQRQIAGDYE